MLKTFMVGKWQAAAELTIWPLWMIPKSDAHMAFKCSFSSLFTKMTLPIHSFSRTNSLIYCSPAEPACVLITVAKLSRGRALGEREVGAEYLSRNSRMPFLVASAVNSASLSSLPGA